MNKITIYTDGAVSGNGKGNAKGGWAAIILQESAPPIEICGAENDTTNQRMELMAVLKAFEKIAASEYDEIEILSDSAYFCNCYNQNWYEKWLINGFQTASKQPVKNVDLWMPLIKYFKLYHNLTITKVKGHAGNFYNEKVDKLAVQARLSI